MRQDWTVFIDQELLFMYITELIWASSSNILHRLHGFMRKTNSAKLIFFPRQNYPRLLHQGWLHLKKRTWIFKKRYSVTSLSHTRLRNNQTNNYFCFKLKKWFRSGWWQSDLKTFSWWSLSLSTKNCQKSVSSKNNLHEKSLSNPDKIRQNHQIPTLKSLKQ